MHLRLLLLDHFGNFFLQHSLGLHHNRNVCLLIDEICKPFQVGPLGRHLLLQFFVFLLNLLELLIQLLDVLGQLVVGVLRVCDLEAALRQLALDALSVNQAALHFLLLLTK